jgi:hypothetical protein
MLDCGSFRTAESTAPMTGVHRFHCRSAHLTMRNRRRQHGQQNMEPACTRVTPQTSMVRRRSTRLQGASHFDQLIHAHPLHLLTL